MTLPEMWVSTPGSDLRVHEKDPATGECIDLDGVQVAHSVTEEWRCRGGGDWPDGDCGHDDSRCGRVLVAWIGDTT